MAEIPYVGDHIYVISKRSGVEKVAREHVAVSDVGQKSYGISVVPRGWVPEYFCLASDLFSLDRSAPTVFLSLSAHVLENSLNEVLGNLRWNPGARIHVRSSSLVEDLSQRGRYISRVCIAKDVSVAIREVCDHVAKSSLPTAISLLIQRTVDPAAFHGHLSNERRLCQESRNWLAEYYEPTHRQGVVESFQVKDITTKRMARPTELPCPYHDQIIVALREPARWATEQKIRIHYEWVWDGWRVWMVQADRAIENKGGKNPTQLSRVPVPPNPTSLHLSAFALYQGTTKTGFRKIDNTAAYRKAGLPTVPLWILSDERLIRSLRAGQCPPEVERDVAALAQKPLVIRTDIANASLEQTQMLPRSDALSTEKEAIQNLIDYARQLGHFIDAGKQVAFILHHYLPAISSAFCYASPDERKVRIESIWGLADGLSYFSHDSFEVDCGTRMVEENLSDAGKRFQIREKVRYKPRFLADNGKGQWVTEAVALPWDRKRSITSEHWIREMAFFTKRFSQEIGIPVNMMWFVGVDKKHLSNRLLPWYHEKPEALSFVNKAPDTRRIVGYYPAIRTKEDVQQLLVQPQLFGRPVQSLRLEPESSALRDPDFARSVAELSKKHQIRIELAGGILSHTFYILQTEGALVECIDPLEDVEQTESFGKLVRDKIPDKVVSAGELAGYTALVGEELIRALKGKIVEEAWEAFEAHGRGALIEELADLQEIVGALCERLMIDQIELEKKQTEKRRARGGFEKGYVLTQTRNPPIPRETPTKQLFPDVDAPVLGKLAPDEKISITGHSTDEPRFTVSVPLFPSLDGKDVAETRIPTKFGEFHVRVVIREKRARMEFKFTPSPAQLQLFPAQGDKNSR